MANRFSKPKGSWLRAEELLDNGDPDFVDELCQIADADRLGGFAKTWYADRRPASRKLMFAYLDRSLNNFRHEALVKRLLKIAEEKNDDELMAKFLVAFDRSIRRRKVTRRHFDWNTRESWSEDRIQTPADTQMPRDERVMQYRLAMGKGDEAQQMQLFSLATRKYLRRRLWRYFREIGKRDPKRYVTAVVGALVGYTDRDCADGLALLDNWGLVHILFHDSDVLISRRSGWNLQADKSLGQLQPSPAFSQAWEFDAAPLVQILSEAKCRPVRQWAMQLLRKSHPQAFESLPVTTLLNWLSSDDAELARLAADALKRSTQTNAVTMKRWLELLDSSNPEVLEVVCEIILHVTNPDSLSLQEVVTVASGRPIPVARMGAKWLEKREVKSAGDCGVLLQLCEAQAEPVRSELVRLARQKITQSSYYQSGDVMELLDSRHDDVREIGWDWLLTDDRASVDVTNWQRLLETPYDTIQLKLADFVERQIGNTSSSSDIQEGLIRPKDLDAKLIRLLWANVLLNIHRGGKQKPAIVTAIVQRLEKHPDEAAELLPILCVALRSVRSVEWRAGLTGVVQLVQRRPDLQEMVEQAFPELELV